MFENVKKVASKLMYAVPVVVFLGFVFYITAMTYTEEKLGTVQKTIEETRFNFTSYVNLSNKFEELLQKNIFKKYGFINLNGRIAKYLGFNSLNNVQKLANGYLAGFGGLRDVTESSKNIVRLNKFLSERGIHFLFVLAPRKEAMYDAKFAPGYGNNFRGKIENIVSTLRAKGINVLDLSSWFQEHSWRMEDLFFKTDHHWTPQAGLVAAQQIMELLQQQSVVEYDREKLQEKNYKIKILKDWFLGAQGRRTGKQYTGVDDFSVYYPKFTTDYSYDGLNFGKWIHSNSLLDAGLIREKNLFESNPYVIYMHGDFGFRATKNTKGLNDKRILIIGESFKVMVEYFLTTQFQQVYTFDSRYNQDETLAQCIEEIKPNIVLMCVNIAALDVKKVFEFGIEEYNQALAETDFDNPAVPLGSFEISAQARNNGNFVTIASNLEAGQTYTLTVGNGDTLKGKPRHIQITLQDQTTNKPIVNHYFETGKTNKQKWIFTVPKQQDNYGLYLYSGTKGHTANTSVRLSNIFLQKGIHEG